MKKALITATIAEFIAGFEFSDIQILQSLGYEVHYASNCENSEAVRKLDSIGAVRHDVPFVRNPFDRNNISAYKTLCRIINEGNYDIIHCHTPVGGVLTRLATRKCRKKGTKVLYTAHGFHFYKGAPLKNWLLYYPVEKLCSYFTDVLITINKEDYALAQRKMKAQKIVYIPGVGIDLQKYSGISVDKAEKRKELGIPNDAVLLLSVGELSHRKNHNVVIKALAEMKEINYQYYIAGQGDLKGELEALISDSGLSDQVHLLGYRSDVAELCNATDIFVFPSLQEGLPVALMEAMASGLPVVCSRIRGNTDLIDESMGGVMFDPKNIEDLKNALDRILKSNIQNMGNYNVNKIKEFDLINVKCNMMDIYKRLI